MGHSGIILDYYSNTSPLRRWNTLGKMGYSIGMISICIGFDRWQVSLLILTILGSLICYKGRISINIYLSWMRVPLGFIFLSLLPVVLEYARVPKGAYFIRFGMGYIYTSLAQLHLAAVLYLKLVASITCLYFLVVTTPIHEIIMALGKLSCPPLIIEIMYLMYRFIFILLGQYQKLLAAGKARGGYTSFRRGCYTFGSSVGQLFLLSLKNARHTLESMEARGYKDRLSFYVEEEKIQGQQLWISTVTMVGTILLGIWARG